MPVTKDDLLAAAKASVNPIEPDEVQQWFAQSLVLDVREPAEFDMGHLPSAVNIPRGLLEFMVGQHPALTDMSAPILLYCKNGGRSTLAAHTLKQMGFDHVRMLVGGFEQWQGEVHRRS